jgi:hypothetical protein
MRRIGPSSPQPSDQIKTIFQKRLWVYKTWVSNSSQRTTPEYQLLRVRTMHECQLMMICVTDA